MKFVFVLLSFCVYFSPSMSYYEIWDQPQQLPPPTITVVLPPSQELPPSQPVQPPQVVQHLQPLPLPQPILPPSQLVQPSQQLQQPPQPTSYHCFSTQYPGVAMIYPGEIIYVADKCMRATCHQDKSLSYQKCAKDSPYCRVLSPGDLTKPFPHCCAKTACYDRPLQVLPQLPPE